tara:strand:- start:2299 stop:2523 length:225 start_codon:yes stop_codon:yes gene_type:complete
MKIIRILGCLLLITISYACKKNQDSDCINSKKIDLAKACIEIYQPVCGCDQKTYSNYCFAEINGLNSWTEGACK